MPKPADPANGFTLVYDAWNRLVAVKDGSDFVQRNEFDGLGRRIVKQRYSGGSLTETRHYYYNDQWQVVEERLPVLGGLSYRVDAQYVWHPHYVDALAMRYWDHDASGGPDTEHYYLQDANFNVTAIVDDGGDAVERYAYTPYGKPTVLNPDFSVKMTQTSAIDNTHLFTGREYDWETGLQLNRNRFYASHLGRWANQDPIGYAGGSLNLYEYVGGAPTIWVDPIGEQLAPPAPAPAPVAPPAPAPVAPPAPAPVAPPAPAPVAPPRPWPGTPPVFPGPHLPPDQRPIGPGLPGLPGNGDQGWRPFPPGWGQQPPDQRILPNPIDDLLWRDNWWRNNPAANSCPQPPRLIYRPDPTPRIPGLDRDDWTCDCPKPDRGCRFLGSDVIWGDGRYPAGCVCFYMCKDDRRERERQKPVFKPGKPIIKPGLLPPE